VRDGLADLWEWWADCAHLRPQFRTDRWKKSVIEPPFVEELIRWAAPLTAEENEALPLESSTSIDAHLGDALCQICAMIHFYIAVKEGLKQIEPGTLEYVKFDRNRKFQRIAKRDQIELVLFAPGGEDVKPYHRNPYFKHYCARINSAFGGPRREFPSRAILNGVYLADADLSFTILAEARLDSAVLSWARLIKTALFGANLAGANLAEANLSESYLFKANLAGANLRDAHLSSVDLDGAIGLTREQIESAWIDEATILPEEFEEIKPEILERQRLRQEQIENIGTVSSALEVEALEEQEKE
jgi:hypothetical protein